TGTRVGSTEKATGGRRCPPVRADGRASGGSARHGPRTAGRVGAGRGGLDGPGGGAGPASRGRGTVAPLAGVAPAESGGAGRGGGGRGSGPPPDGPPPPSPPPPPPP